MSAASAVDINSSTALEYYGDGSELDLQADTSGNFNITDIANFTESQITFFQPLSLQSPGSLSVANGIDLTGTSSNTIDSYSTLYLQTSSGSPSDIVLQPTGDVGIDANLSMTGDIDLGGNSLKDIGGLQNCGSNEFVNGNGNCEVDTDTDTSKGEDEVESDIFDTGDNNQGNLGLNGNEIQGINNIRADGSTQHRLFTPADTATSNDRWEVWDTSNSQSIAVFREGGNVDIPNGDLTVGGNNIIWGSTDISESDIDALNDGVIDEGEINQNTLDDSEVADNSLTEASIAGNSVGSSELIDNSIEDSELQDNVIDNSEVQNGDSFTFSGITNNGDLDMQKNEVRELGSFSYRLIPVNGDKTDELESPSKLSNNSFTSDWGLYTNEQSNSDIHMNDLGYNGNGVGWESGIDVITPNLNQDNVGVAEKQLASYGRTGRVYFQFWMKTFNDRENVHVWITTDGGSNWKKIRTFDNNYERNDYSPWQRVSLDITPYITQATSGSDIRIQIDESGNGGGDEVNIDHLQLAYAPHRGSWNLGYDGELFYNAGRLGVGTDNPSTQLDVGGSLRADSLVGDSSGSQCGSNEFLNGNGNCQTDTDTTDGTDSDSDSEDQQLSYSSDGTSSGGAVTDSLSITDGNGVTVNSISFDDDYEANSMRSENDVESYVFDTGDNDQGNLGLNGNSIVDNSGAITLGSGNVEVPNGNLDMSGNYIQDSTAYTVWDEGNSRESWTTFSDGASLSIRDLVNNKDAITINPGSSPTVNIPNGNLDVGSNNVQDIGNLYQDDSGSNFFQSSCSQGQVIGGINSDGSYDCVSSSGQVTDVWVNETGDEMSGNLEVNAQMTSDSAAFGVSESTGGSELSDSTVYVGGNLEVQNNILGRGGDVAENVPTGDGLERGEVAVIGGNMSLEESREAYDNSVAGVVSTDPSMVLAKERDGKPLALTGIVPVEVTVRNGDIEPGDLLTPSGIDGKAMKCRDEEKCENAVIGKAMQGTDENGKVKVLLTMG